MDGDLLSEFDDRELGFFLFDYPDYDAQLAAIRSILRLRALADEQFEHELKDIEQFIQKATGSAAAQAGDAWVDHLHNSVFQDAAHSMAAAGMLAPFFESLFTQAFLGIEKRFQSRALEPKPGRRWALPAGKRWNCHYDAGGRLDIIKGIFDLAELTELAPLLPPHLRPTLKALFGYRNANFHYGFEWPPDERMTFEKKIKDQRWNPIWFDRSTSGDKPWIIYMSHHFVAHCLATVDQVLEAFGKFVRRTQ